MCRLKLFGLVELGLLSVPPVGMASRKAAISKRATLHILPCTVSQLLSACQVSNDTFAIWDWELNQVSAVGLVRGLAPFVTNIQYSVDDMTGPPLNVKQWVNSEGCRPMTFASPGTYVKVTGSLHSFNGQRSLLAMNIRCIKDLNEITSHMLEVVQAHMQLFGKAFDVNMNTTAASQSGGVLRHRVGGHPEGIQGQVLHAIRSFSVRVEGVSFHELKTRLDYLSMRDIRYLLYGVYYVQYVTLDGGAIEATTSLTFLINEGHVFSTIDEHHFKSTER